MPQTGEVSWDAPPPVAPASWQAQYMDGRYMSPVPRIPDQQMAVCRITFFFVGE